MRRVDESSTKVDGEAFSGDRGSGGISGRPGR